MPDQNLHDDMLKLVRYKILFVKRDYEHAFPEQEELVPDNTDEAGYTAWKIATFMQQLREQRRTTVPEKWKQYPPHDPRYRDGSTLLGFPEADKKYLRVYYEVLERWPREPFRFEQRQIDVLEEIRDRVQPKKPAPRPPAIGEPLRPIDERIEAPLRPIEEPLRPPEVVTTLAGAVGQAGFQDGSVAQARFHGPMGLAVAPDGTLYVADRDNQIIRQVTPAGVVTTLAGTAGQAGFQDGEGAQARFNYLYGVAAAADGTVYVADTHNHVIRQVSRSGDVTTLAGAAGQAGYQDGAGAQARFTYPVGVAVAADGTVYVADHDNHVIRQVSRSGDVTTLAGAAGQVGYQDGAGAQARFHIPVGVAVAADGTLYVVDHSNHVIRQVTSTGVVTTLAGAAGQAGFQDGEGAQARFNYPYGVTVAADGTLYVADRDNQIIRRVTPAGVVTTLAGAAGQAGHQDGTWAQARFNTPYGVTVAADGTLYVADTHNHTIRRLTPAPI